MSRFVGSFVVEGDVLREASDEIFARDLDNVTAHRILESKDAVKRWIDSHEDQNERDCLNALVVDLLEPIVKGRPKDLRTALRALVASMGAETTTSIVGAFAASAYLKEPASE